MNEQNENKDDKVVQPSGLEPVKGNKLSGVAKYTTLTFGGLLFMCFFSLVTPTMGATKTARLKLEERKARLQEVVKQEQLQLEQASIENESQIVE